MSMAPHVMHLRQGTKMGTANMIDSMIHDGLTDAFDNIHMGITAENLAKQYNISRSEQDEYAVHSQNLAENAQKNGYFAKEIVAVEIVERKGTIVFDKDEYIKHGTKVESLQKLKPCFVDVNIEIIKYFEFILNLLILEWNCYTWKCLWYK